MKDDDSPRKPAPEDPENTYAAEDFRGAANSDEPRDPTFTDFDEDADYEASERDTDYASAYEEESGDDKRGDSEDEEDSDGVSAAWKVLGGEPRETGNSLAAGGSAWDTEASTEPRGEDSGMGTGAAMMATDPDLFANDREDEYPGQEDEGTDWEDSREYPEEPGEFETAPAGEARGWPIGLILVGILALLLLAAGGYGVIQQRSAAQQEIRQLQAALATAASPAEVTASREALLDMEQQNETSLAKIRDLELDNRRLGDTVAGLEKQLAAQQAEAPGIVEPVPAPAAPAARTATDVTGAAVKATPDKAAATDPGARAGGGDWFVNFSSYSQRGAAEKWLKKLSPAAGKAVVTPVDIDGRILYRLRIVDLIDRAQAEKVAAGLQSDHKLSSLWVGRQ